MTTKLRLLGINKLLLALRAMKLDGSTIVSPGIVQGRVKGANPHTIPLVGIFDLDCICLT